LLIKSYSTEFFRPKCNPGFVSVHCVAHLDEDISEALPYVNSALGGGGDYVRSPPTLTLRVHGKLIALHGREIFVNAIKDEEEADKILTWVKKEINEAWANRDNITPCYEKAPEPRMIDILKLLPKTNCGKCSEPTCMVFALKVVEGVKGPVDCPDMSNDKKDALEVYLSQFTLSI
jgi:ArsR family metal-binding transcriptional regulator